MSAEREFDPRLIRLVTARYREMHGLVTAGDGAVLICIGAFFRFTDDDTFSTSAEAVAACAIVAVIAYLFFARRHVERYYASRFGRVGGRGYMLPFALYYSIATSWMQMWCGIPGPWWVRAPLAGAAAVPPIIVWPGWIAKRDAPLRWAWALVAIAGVVASLRLPINHPEAQYVWRGNALLYGGAALMIAGLCDHAVLLRALGRGKASETAHE